MKIGVLGLGWLGAPLAKYFLSLGHEVSGTCTSEEKAIRLQNEGINAYQWCYPSEDLTSLFLNELEVLIINIPPSKLKEQYLDCMRLIENKIATLALKKVIFVSSSGVFSDENTICNELSIPTPNTTSGQLLYEAEQLFLKNKLAIIVRLAGLYGEGRHPGQWFAAKKDIPNGQAPVNLISLEQCLPLFSKLIFSEFAGKIIHGVENKHPSRASFYTQASLELGLEKPQFIDELISWKKIESIY